MHVASLAYRTDLALLRMGGSQITDRGGHVVIRSPHNPAFMWGNFLLLPRVPPPEDTATWLDTFAAEFPDADHLAIGFDGTAGSVDELAGFSEAGLAVEGSTVMTATAVHEPPRPQRNATYRTLVSDADWQQQVELQLACHDGRHGDAAYLAFVIAKARTMRGMVEAGHGGWFGAFVDGRLQSAMGLFVTGSGLARFQSVETHPDARGRGLAGTLVHHASRQGAGAYGAETFVMVADPEYSAIRVYRSVGFAATETQLQAQRLPPLTADG